MDRRKILLIVLRVLAVPVTVVAGAGAIEFGWVSFVTYLVGGLRSLEDWMFLAAAVGLLLLCALGVKFIFNLRINFLVILTGILALLIAVLMWIQGTVFLG